ncbi:MAG: hypothetical protein ACP5OZ_04630 [Candidatus Woesearchaeota archaeon]
MKTKKIKKNKFGLTMSVELIFIILIATIVTMLVVILISKNFLSSQKFLCKLTGTCEQKEELIKDVGTINATCEDAKSEIIKHAKLCKQHGDEGTIKETCYVIFLPKDCGPKKDELYNELVTKHNLNATVFYEGDKKAVILYNYDKKIVEIR